MPTPHLWRCRRPTADEVRSFLSAVGDEPFSYAPVGGTRSGERPEGFDDDAAAFELGQGDDVHRRAVDALRSWQMFPPGWTRIEPSGAPLRVGVVVAMVAGFLGTWWLNAARIVHVIDDVTPDGCRRFGFAYGTLQSHVERGEEQFLVTCRPGGSVHYSIESFSRPRHPAVRLAYPVTRRLQRRFVRESGSRMTQLCQ